MKRAEISLIVANIFSVVACLLIMGVAYDYRTGIGVAPAFGVAGLLVGLLLLAPPGALFCKKDLRARLCRIGCILLCRRYFSHLHWGALFCAAVPTRNLGGRPRDLLFMCRLLPVEAELTGEFSPLFEAFTCDVCGKPQLHGWVGWPLRLLLRPRSASSRLADCIVSGFRALLETAACTPGRMRRAAT